MVIASRFLRYIPEAPMRGPDVLDVQERLRDYGLYVGPLDSIYGRGTYDGVLAFQAGRGLMPDGVVGPSTYSALGSGQTPPVIGERGPSIDIDTTERKLYLNQGGRLVRMYDIAAGAPNNPTPLGRWVVVEKVMNPGGPFGTRWIRLNIPWGGYGIHGTNDENSIGKAVSHGCIRLRNADVAELYNRVMLGTLVNITGQLFTGRVLLPGKSEGSDVKVVQELLSYLGYFEGVPDGVYGPTTAAAVRRFQADQNLVADAIVGPQTYDALQQAIDVVRGDTEP